ncbi:MAG: DUF1801 domain-containing protein [Candidatus Eremiobacteraeota bacterium]|nr:DUF1801 domain-containing protein [Candidatus Eremiobacteraeota bacterium]MBV8365446.1 DUF1801 domain-containing protein [Candidatus Eremiobacteraeota bacterium]
MSKSKIDEYLKEVEPAKRRELARIRALAKKSVPDAEETISYGMPAMTYDGQPFLGFDAHKTHIGIYPFSGRVLPALKETLRGYASSKGALRVPLDKPIPERTLKRIISERLKQIKAARRER